MGNITFIVGAGRSGTTLLYKLLALHPQVRVITNYDVHFGRFSPAGYISRLAHRFPQLEKSMWFRAGGAAHFQHGLRRVFPLPVEGEPIYSRCGVPLEKPGSTDAPPRVIERLRREFSRLQGSGGASVFITKRTANNRRLAWLKQAFPDARFIHLVRDGRDVAYSLSKVRFWREHLVWWAGCKPEQLEAQGWQPLKVCARNWVEDVRSVEQGLQGVEPERQLTLSYEQLVNGWEPTLSTVCEFLDLDMSARFVSTVRSLEIRSREPKWRGIWTSEQLETVLEEQRGLLAEYGYS